MALLLTKLKSSVVSGGGIRAVCFSKIPKRVLIKQVGRNNREITTNIFAFLSRKEKTSRLCMGILGAVVGFSMANAMTENESVLARLRNLRVIQCANAVEAYNDEDEHIEEEKKSRKSKRSSQFNFIADAIESATPAVVYIEVCCVNSHVHRFSAQ